MSHLLFVDVTLMIYSEPHSGHSEHLICIFHVCFLEMSVLKLFDFE